MSRRRTSSGMDVVGGRRRARSPVTKASLVALALLLSGCGSRSTIPEATQPEQPSADAGVGPPTTQDSGAPHGWISAADSTFKTFSMDGACLEKVGCPFKPKQVPLCPANTNGVSLQEALEAFQTNGPSTTAITVSTRIWFEAPTQKTLSGCTMKQCCTVFVGKFYFADAPDSVPGAGARAFPWNDQYPDAFSWLGDVSGRCTGIDVQDGQPIVINGQLVHADGGGGFEMLAPELCSTEAKQ